MNNYKLGKNPAIKDLRTLRLTTIVPVLPPVPEVWDYDTNCNLSIPTPIFGNDVWGNCVLASRSHQTLRFEGFEQGNIIDIKDSDVLHEYWLEQNANCLNLHPDGGLVLLDSLKAWRNKGWRINGNRYDIHAFASINPLNTKEVKLGMYLFSGASIGLQLPLTVQEQLEHGETWDWMDKDGNQIDSWNGHCIYLCGFDSINDTFTFISWGKKFKMTRKFLETYCDEFFVVIDNRDSFVKDSIVDIETLDNYLKML
jgi:hypothetical protein